MDINDIASGNTSIIQNANDIPPTIDLNSAPGSALNPVSNVPKPITFSRTPYIVIAVICLALIIIWVTVLMIMHFTNSGIFGGSTERPPPSDPALYPINGEPIELTPEQQNQLNAKITEALNNLGAS